LTNSIYLAKPDDGAGCEDTFLFEDAADLEGWLAHHPERKYVVQPYLAGIAASVSCMMQAGTAVLLSVNRQHVERQDNALIFKGVSVNALPSLWQAAEKLAQQIAKAMPDLRGYVGIDVIVQDGELLVLEINPRLTTSYAGLRESIGRNPAELMLQMLENPDSVPENLTRKSIEIHV
jgi:predicted ATP-grasp superfamily ATP-dependent carboligase